MKSLLTKLRRQAKPLTPLPVIEASDIISCLPFELHFLILDNLDPSDVAAALNACRAWRQIWLSPEIWPRLADRWYPGLTEHIRTTAAPGEDPGEKFRRALHRSQRSASGRFASALHYALCLESNRMFKLSKGVPLNEGGVHAYQSIRDQVVPDDDRWGTFKIYSNGRIAWWPEAYGLPFFAVIDDLRTMTRKAYEFPDHKGERLGYKTAMGSELFLMGKDRTLHAWHLQKDRLHSVELPEPFERCVTDAKCVLLVSKHASVYTWRPGEVLRRIDMSPVPHFQPGPVGWGHPDNFPFANGTSHRLGIRLRQNGMPVDFIVHPHLDGVFFVVAFFQGELMVHEFADGQLTDSYTYAVGQALESRGELRWEKSDAHGGYSLVLLISDPHIDAPGQDQTTNQASSPCEGRDALISLCFNIYTKTFSTLCHHAHPVYDAKTLHLWNRQMNCASSLFRQDFVDLSVHALVSCADNQHHESPDLPSLYTSLPERLDEMGVRRRRKIALSPAIVGIVDEMIGDSGQQASCQARYFLDSRQIATAHPNGEKLQTGVPGTTDPKTRLVGDDDFLIYFADYLYIAWSFETEFAR
ncbi:hypothetical protein BX600DRAFT_294818 [Xylariales sp. PMI_506]|nr:hypothetical protein BX600DRAFT_294818 [Xylariales sp. PMI_506]